VQVSKNAYLTVKLDLAVLTSVRKIRLRKQWAIYEYVMRQIREFTPKEEAHHAPLIRREEAE
jgi:hypothetical protein